MPSAAAAPKARAADDHLIGSIEVARILGVHPVTVHRYLVKRSDFPPHVRIGGNRLSWWRSDIIAFIELRAATEPQRKRAPSAGAGDDRSACFAAADGA